MGFLRSPCPRSSALLAALSRTATAEIAHFRKEVGGGAFHDFHKFFDSMNIAILLDLARTTDYPPVEMALAMQQHQAARIMNISSFVSKPIVLHNSFTAGCYQSVAMTKAYLEKDMVDLHNHEPDVFRGEVAKSVMYVDDCSQTARHKSASKVFNRLESQFIFSIRSERFSSLNCLIKNTLGPLSRTCSKFLRSYANCFFQIHFVKYKIAKHTRDLGVSYKARFVRPSMPFKSRLSSSASRNNKVVSLALVNRRARISHEGSSLPAAIWGHQACGIWPSVMLDSERIAAHCVGITPQGRRRTTCLNIFYGQYSLISNLSQFYLVGELDDLSKAWRMPRTKLKLGNGTQ